MARVLIPLAQGCEELEAVTIIDLMVRAGIDVVTASLDDERCITASRGVQLMAQTTLEQALLQPYDMVVLPGGLPGATYLQQDERIIQLIQQMDAAGKDVAAVCAAPKVLVTAGVLNGKRATSFPGVIDKTPAEGMQYVTDPVVVDGNVVTSRGPGTAMEFTLVLIARLMGEDVRQTVEKPLQRM